MDREKKKDQDGVSRRNVRRRLQDFLLLRKEIMHEHPETFLPTLRDLVDLDKINFWPPPMGFVEETVRRLDQFMQCISSHPNLWNHDLVRTFLRSAELQVIIIIIIITNGFPVCGGFQSKLVLQVDVLQMDTFARRKLLIERICEMYPSSATDNEEYFLTFTQNTVTALRDGLLNVVHAGRRVLQCQRGKEKTVGCRSIDRRGLRGLTILIRFTKRNGSCCTKLRGSYRALEWDDEDGAPAKRLCQSNM